MAAIDATLSNLVGYHDVVLVQPQRVRRHLPAAARLVRQEEQPRRGGRVVRRLHRRGLRPRAAGHARAPPRPPRARADASTCSSSRRATRTATCSTCRRSAAPRTSTGLTVICDATVGTPILQPVLRRDDPMERPDFVIHSYTKDLAGTGTTTAGVCIGRNERMFIPKGDSVTATGPGRQAVRLPLGRDAVLERVLREGRVPRRRQGVRGDQRHAHGRAARAAEGHQHAGAGARAGGAPRRSTCAAPRSRATRTRRCASAPCSSACRRRCSRSTSTPRWDASISRHAFKRFFDCLEPAFGLQVTLGQINTVVLCPALTSHSELSERRAARGRHLADDDPDRGRRRGPARTAGAPDRRRRRWRSSRNARVSPAISASRTKSTRCTSRSMLTCIAAMRRAGRGCGNCWRSSGNGTTAGPFRPALPLPSSTTETGEDLQ